MDQNIAFHFSGRKATLADMFKLQIEPTFRKISIIYAVTKIATYYTSKENSKEIARSTLQQFLMPGKSFMKPEK